MIQNNGSNNTILLNYGPYLKKGMKPREVIYLHYLKECKFNKTEAYMKLNPEVSKVNASKNVGKIDKRIRDKFPEQYKEVGAIINSVNVVDMDGQKYIAALATNHGNKSAAIKVVKPHLAPKSLGSAAMQMELKLDARHPDWRVKLSDRYDPSRYFEKIDKIANPGEDDGYVPADVQRKACLDMLAMENFTKKETDTESDRSKRAGKYTNQIKKVLLINVDDGGTLNITKADDQ